MIEMKRIFLIAAYCLKTYWYSGVNIDFVKIVRDKFAAYVRLLSTCLNLEILVENCRIIAIISYENVNVNCNVNCEEL